MSLSFALLGFLNYMPMTGYDLKKILDDSTNFFWSAHTSQIYRELKTLEKEEYIISEVKPSEKGPNKKEYCITENGVLYLKKWLGEAHVDENMKNNFMVWLLFSSGVGLDELNSQVQIKLEEYKKEYEILKTVEEVLARYVKRFGKEGEDFYWKIVLKRGFYDVDAKIRWAEEILNDIKLKSNEK